MYIQCCKNHVRVFSFSGDFLISEIKALSQYDCLIAGLVSGQIKPLAEYDNCPLAVDFSHKNAETA
jgi:uncharacterized protein YifE (UPF0438 family)